MASTLRPYPQEQLWQRQGEGSTGPGCADDHHAHPPDARTHPRADPGGRLEILCPLWTAPAFADKNHGKRLWGDESRIKVLIGNIILRRMTFNTTD